MTLRKVVSQSEFQKSVELAKKNPANGLKFNLKATSYIMVEGIPCKLVNGSYVQLTKMVK